MPTQEFSRLLHNLLRFGTVTAVDHQRAQCRVSTGDLTTDWLSWVTLSAGALRSWQAPTLGEQVLLLCPGGELSAGVVLRGLYCDAYPAPSHEASLSLMQFSDGAVMVYDPEQHALQISLPDSGAITLNAPAAITLNAPRTVCNGDLFVQGQVSYAGGLVGSGGDGAQIDGKIQASGDIQAGDISLSNHKHGGVETGRGTTGGPQ